MGNECKKNICECETCLEIKKDNLEIKFTFSTKKWKKSKFKKFKN